MTDRDTIIGSYVHDRDSSTKQAPKFMTQPAVLSGLQVQGEAMGCCLRRVGTEQVLAVSSRKEPGTLAPNLHRKEAYTTGLGI